MFSSQASFEDKMEVCLNHGLDANSYLHHQLPLWILWRLWRSRNILIFQRKTNTWRNVIHQARNDAREWKVIERHIARPSPGTRNQTSLASRSSK